MKTIWQWWKGITLDKISNFFQVALAIAAIGLMPLCLNTSAYWNETITSIINIKNFVPAALAVVALVVNIWLMRRQLRLQKERVKKEFPHDGLEGLFKGFAVMATSGVGFFLAVGIVVVLTLPFWKEMMSLIVSNLGSIIAASLVIFGVAITIWRIMAENKKERQERSYANKVLMDKGLESLKE